MGMYIVAKFGTDWSIFADAIVSVKTPTKVKPRLKVVTLYHTIRLKTTLAMKPFENTVGKGKKIVTSISSQCFLPFSKEI